MLKPLHTIACLLACVWFCFPAFAADRPNVLLITTDDLNWDSLGCFGNELKGVTPNLDALAKQGTRFEHAYVTIAICQPGRAAIMTARYPHRNGALGFDKINKGVPTLPETLRKAGYYTAVIGKASHTVPSRHATAFDQTFNRHDLGFGRSLEKYRAVTAGQIAKAKQQRKPFFLNVNLHDPHRPFANAPQENRDKRPKIWEGVPLVGDPYKPDEVPLPGFLPDLPEIRLEIAEYYTSVRRMDQIIGGLLKVLDESGQADNTLVIFLSDHGIAVPFAKTNCWMHSNKTPLIVRWPGKTKPGSVVADWMVNSIDLAPTILEIVGMENLEGADGMSVIGLLDPTKAKKWKGRMYIVTHINTLSSKKAFAMRGVITMSGSYIWNAWSDGKTAFRNESMSGRTFKAMQQAAENDSSIAKRVRHYLYRAPEEYYDYDTDPDALE
ncbi:MAG: sulfatase, partial [Planctomycetota bacterium]